MAHKLPYVAVPSTISKILKKVKEAKTPERFTQDFLETKLGCKGGNYRQFIPFAKKIGLLNSDGTPTNLYKQFRNVSSTKVAVATAAKKGFRELFERNEYAQDLSKDKLKGLVLEITGLESKNKVVNLICQTFEILKSLGDFTGAIEQKSDADEPDDTPFASSDDTSGNSEGSTQDLNLNLAYSINLVLPKTNDPAVFNAIFKSLRENLLRK